MLLLLFNLKIWLFQYARDKGQIYNFLVGAPEVTTYYVTDTPYEIQKLNLSCRTYNVEKYTEEI